MKRVLRDHYPNKPRIYINLRLCYQIKTPDVRFYPNRGVECSRRQVGQPGYLLFMMGRGNTICEGSASHKWATIISQAKTLRKPLKRRRKDDDEVFGYSAKKTEWAKVIRSRMAIDGLIEIAPTEPVDPLKDLQGAIKTLRKLGVKGALKINDTVTIEL